VRASLITAAIITASAASFAVPADVGPARSFATAAPVSSPDEAYDLIAATPCLCGGALVPYAHYVEYRDDAVYEIYLSRCATCREERPFFVDLTPAFGKLSAFLQAKLATRGVVPEGDLPCPTYESAIAVDSITEEYIILENTGHSCGANFVSSSQALQAEGGHHYDVLHAACPADGAQAEFYFNIDAFIFHAEGYPELAHMKRAGEPPAALPGRTLSTAVEGDEAAHDKFLAEATHGVDGGKLNVAATWIYRAPDDDYVVVDATCEECGTPVRLYLRSGPQP
jgi:hypothetical protein